MSFEEPIRDSDLWLAERLVDAAERLGEGVTAILERIESEDPSKAERLKNLLPSIEAMTQLALGRSAQCLDVLDPPVIQALGDFRILRMIGIGGMATVYEAIQISLNRRVALKILPTLSARDPLKLKRFQIEAQAAACLHHPHIVPLYLVESSQGVHYYAMRLIEGRTVADDIAWARRQARTASTAAGVEPSQADQASPVGLGSTLGDAGPFLLGGDPSTSFRHAADLAQQAAHALHYAHQQGILHRDVKPSNLLLDHAGWLYVADFGLARIDGQADLTQSGALLGTPRYMSPEQASPTRSMLDQRTDVYSLGAVLYEMITLRPLFDGDDRQRILGMIAEEDPTPPRRLNPAIPRDLETITVKATAKDPADRYSTAQEMADDLDRFLNNQPIHARVSSLLDRASRWTRRHRAAARASLMTGLMLVVALGIAAGWRYSLLNRHYLELRSALDQAERSEAFTRRLWYDSQVRLAYQASDSGELEFAQELLESLRGRPAGADPRGFEWHYLWRLCQRDFSVLSRHDRPVGSVTVSPDGRTLATTDDEGMLILWDLVAGRESSRRQAHQGLISGLEYSPDGSQIVTWSSPGEIPSDVRIWASDAGGEPQVVPGITGYVDRASFSHDGGQLVVVEHGTKSPARSCATIWSVSARAGRIAPVEPPRQASDFVFSPRGPGSATLGLDGTVTIESVRGHETRSRQSRPIAGESRLAFSPDGRAVAAGGGKGITILDATTGRETASFNTPTRGRPRFSAAGRWLAAVAANEKQLILIEHPTLNARLIEPLGSIPRDPRFSFSRAGDRLALTGLGESPAIWDLKSQGEPRGFPGSSPFSSPSAFSADGDRLFFAGADGRVRAWRFAQPPSVRESFQAHDKEVWAVVFTPDGNDLISSGDDHKIKVWTTHDRRLKRTLEGHDSLVAGLAVSAKGDWLASAGFDRSVRLWDVATGTPGFVLQGHTDRIRSVVFVGPGEKGASAGSDGTIRLWDLASGKTLAVDRRHSNTVRAIAADHLGRYLASAGDDRMLMIWDLEHDDRSFRVATARQNSALAFSRDGSRLAVGDDWGDVGLWDTRNWTLISTVKASDATIRGLAFSPGGRSLAAACDDGKVRLWDPVTGQMTLALESGGGRVNTVAFSPDGLTLASGSHDGTVTFWLAGEP